MFLKNINKVYLFDPHVLAMLLAQSISDMYRTCPIDISVVQSYIFSQTKQFSRLDRYTDNQEDIRFFEG